MHDMTHPPAATPHTPPGGEIADRDLARSAARNVVDAMKGMGDGGLRMADGQSEVDVVHLTHVRELRGARMLDARVRRAQAQADRARDCDR